MPKAALKGQPTVRGTAVRAAKQIAVSEFKVKCLAIIEEVANSGQEVVITKRGKATAKLIPFKASTVDSLFGRLKGLVEIVGDPDDLIKPVFPLEDYDMLKLSCSSLMCWCGSRKNLEDYRGQPSPRYDVLESPAKLPSR